MGAGLETVRREEEVLEMEAEVDVRVKLKKRDFGFMEMVEERFGRVTGGGERGGVRGMLREERRRDWAAAQRVHGVWDSAMWPQPEWRMKLW